MAPIRSGFAVFRATFLLVLVGFLTSIASATQNTKSTILIIAKDATAAKGAYLSLQGYGIPYQVLAVPQAGVQLPVLNSTATQGNYGGIVVIAEVSYDFGGGAYKSALTDAQWEQLFAYQRTFSARMVRMDVYPGIKFGTEVAIANTGCCAAGVEQIVSLSNSDTFKTANVKLNAGLSTVGLYHYPAKITNATSTTQIAAFEPAGQFTTRTVAAVSQKLDGREQQAWFIGFAPDWSPTSAFLGHAWVNYLTRGLYAGFRRVYLSTQVDDVFLATELYRPVGANFRVRAADIEHHISWMADINKRLPAGSNYKMELGHNGNGDVETSIGLDTKLNCNPPDAIEYPDQIDTALEFVKPIGTGTNIWPATPATYVWTSACTNLDPLLTYFKNTAKRDAFFHVSHTFSHSSLNNATLSDVNKEITFNIAWLKQVGFWNAPGFSPNGLIPPAITGMHNGDAIKAWMDNGIKYVVGDNTRAILRNSQNPYWPVISTVATNGYNGLVIVPRWALTIYYNCDLPSCTLQEWIDTSAGSGDFQNLLKNARDVNSLHLLSLNWDPYMFHQANLRVVDVPTVSVNGRSSQLSLLEIWTEIVTQELVRLTTWPIISLKHDDVAKVFIDRMTRDQCGPVVTWNTSADNKSIVSVTVGAATANSCGAAIPVTLPTGAASVPSGGRSEKIGNDSQTIWVTLRGSPVTINLSTPLSIAA